MRQVWRSLGDTNKVRAIVVVLLIAAFAVPIATYALSDVVTRDSTQNPCPAIDDSTSECRNLRYNAASKGLDVNIVGTGAITVGSISGSTTPADSFTNPTTAILDSSLTALWNGSAWDRSRAASATSFSSATSLGANISERGGRWSAFSNPANGVVATASKAAGVGAVRHVADCISYTASGIAAPAATVLVINLRDGGSGSGNILWSKQIVAPATVGVHADANFCGLNLMGSAATPMTLEFSIPLANEMESVALTGYDVQ